MSKYATAEQLTNVVHKRRFGEVDLPILGVTVRFQSMTEDEYSQYESAVLALKGGGLRKAKLEDANRRFLVLCLVDGDGNRLFADKQVDEFKKWDMADIKILYKACSEHCGISESDIEDLVKNSDAMNASDSATD